MDQSHELSHYSEEEMMDISIVGIVIASIAAFGFGALWYSPVLFMQRWCKEAGIDPDFKPENPTRLYGSTFFMTFITAIGTALILGNDPGVLKGAGIGAILGGVIVMTSMGINYQFAGRTFIHWFIDGGFQTCRFILMGALIGLFQ